MATTDAAGWKRASYRAHLLVARVREAQAACSGSADRETQAYWLGRTEGRAFDLLDYIGRGERGEGAGGEC